METLYDGKIRDLREQIVSLQQEMDRIGQEYVELSKQFVAEWAEKTVVKTVTERHDRAVELNANGQLTQLKNELREFIESVPSIMDSEIPPSGAWAHNAPEEQWLNDPQYQDLIGPGFSPKPGDEQIRMMLGRVGDLLNKYQLIELKQSIEWKRDPQTSKLRYSIGYMQSTGMGLAYQRYVDAGKRLVGLRKVLIETLKQKATTEAQNLWDQA